MNISIALDDVKVVLNAFAYGERAAAMSDGIAVPSDKLPHLVSITPRAKELAREAVRSAETTSDGYLCRHFMRVEGETFMETSLARWMLISFTERYIIKHALKMAADRGIDLTVECIQAWEAGHGANVITETGFTTFFIEGNPIYDYSVVSVEVVEVRQQILDALLAYLK